VSVERVTYDALLVLSFGGPEGPDDVMPFLENVTRGRHVQPDRLAAVAEHYQHVGGVSPINAANRALIEALRAELDAHGVDLPIYWGNRNWHPFVADTFSAMAHDGVTNALVFVTSAYSSYSACRQYQEDLAAAAVAVGERAPRWAKLRHFFDHPGLIEPHVDAVRRAVEGRPDTALVFVAHSIPVAMAESSGPDRGLYVAQLTAAAELIATAAAPDIPWSLAYSSRSGPPTVPWLEPDIGDQLRLLAADGVTNVVVVPIGFVSDHMEVVWDLDVEAADVAQEVGLSFLRTPTPGTDPRFVAMVRELVEERLDPGCPKRALSALGPSHDTCPAECCPAPGGSYSAARG
jgi:ferrochelatase